MPSKPTRPLALLQARRAAGAAAIASTVAVPTLRGKPKLQRGSRRPHGPHGSWPWPIMRSRRVGCEQEAEEASHTMVLVASIRVPSGRGIEPSICASVALALKSGRGLITWSMLMPCRMSASGLLWMLVHWTRPSRSRPR
eukprot:scaffold64190_cov32-Tisochrysis_lutea.AAC.4